MASASLPKISISVDPSKIKDRWQLSALALLLWGGVASLILSTTERSVLVYIVLALTFAVVVAALMLSFGGKPQPNQLPKPPPNILINANPDPGPLETHSRDTQPARGTRYTEEQIIYAAKIIQILEHPAMKGIIPRQQLEQPSQSQQPDTQNLTSKARRQQPVQRVRSRQPRD